MAEKSGGFEAITEFVIDQLGKAQGKDERTIQYAASQLVSEVSAEVSAEVAAVAAAEAASETAAEMADGFRQTSSESR